MGEMMHICLWGNATVRHSIVLRSSAYYHRHTNSLLTNVTHHPTTPDCFEERADRSSTIYSNDGPLAWDLLNRVRQDQSGVSRVDFILDNGE